MHRVKTIAEFHSEFLHIHPIADGNGRIAHLISTLLLLNQKYPPIIIESEEREIYFEKLIESEINKSCEPMVSFFAENFQFQYAMN